MEEIEKTQTYMTLQGTPKDFIEIASMNLHNELNLYWELTQDERLFSYNERAYVGLFSNALVRCDASRFATIQEWAAKDKDGSAQGRGDLLVYDKHSDCFYLFEAKCNTLDETAFYQWNIDAALAELTTTLRQAKSYYDAEIGFYTPKTYLVALYFRPVSLNQGLEVFTSNIFNPKMDNFFFALYHSHLEILKNEGLAVYGMIVKADNF